MDTLENIARIKTTDIKRLEIMRKSLGISGKFICGCLGLHETSWSTWVTQRGSIPDKYLDQVANIFQTIGNLLDGQRCLAVSAEAKKKEENTIDLKPIFEFLETLEAPKVPIFENRHTALANLLRSFSEQSTNLLSRYENEYLKMLEENEKN